MLDELFRTFTEYHPRLKFIIEKGDNSLNFLEVISIIKDNNVLTYDLYHKSSFSGCYLNYFSQHPLSQKLGGELGG